MNKNADDIKYTSVFKDGEEHICASSRNYYAIDTHIHDCYEIDIIQKRSGTAVINDKESVISKGDIIVIPPGMPHLFKGECDIMQVFVTSYFLVENENFFSLLKGSRVFFSGTINKLSSDEFLIVKSNAKKLIECEDMSGVFKEAMKKAIFFLFITELLRVIDSDTRRSKAEEFNESAIVKSIEFIKNRYHEKITVNDLASVSNMSVSAYMRNFVRIFSVTPYEYVNMYRIRHSKKLLEETNLSIANIAQSCGFYDSSHFTRFFKKYERITPSQYKKQWSHKAAF